MKNSGTFVRLILGLLFLGACSRNPLGEDLKQPILNLAFTLTQSCTNSFNQDAAYNCQINTSEVVDAVVFTLDPVNTTCMWVSLNPTTGVVSGTPNDNQVGTCNVAVNASNAFRASPTYVYPIQIINIQPVLTITNAAPMLQSDPAAVIRTDADVQASEEGFGNYSLDNAGTTAPRCFDNSDSLTVDPTTGAVTYDPANAYMGTCFIRILFDDGNALPTSTVSSEFSIQVFDVNDPPILSLIGNQTTNEDVPLVINFTINDDQALNCTTSMSATSSNGALIPVGNIVFTGAAPNCTATITPTSNSSGVSNLRFTVTDIGIPVMATFEDFTLTVNAVNDAPVLGAIGAQNTNEDIPHIINFTITDNDSVLTCATSLSATSSNTTLLPNANVVFGGAAPNCTATITPVLNQSGVTNLTITVADSGMPIQTDFETFAFTVNAVNDAPVLAAIGAQSTNEDVALVIPLNITDVDSVLDCSTSLVAGSSNVGLVPVANVVFGGTVPNCTATVTPVANASGVSNLTITVADSGMPVLTDFETFAFTVIAVNDAPILGAVGNQTTNEDVPLVINFTINDIDSTLNCSTSVAAGSTNTGLIPVASIVFGGAAPNCTATVTPAANASGTSNLTFTLADSGMPVLTDFETFIFTVNAVNDAPVLGAIGNQTTSEDNALIVPFTITDLDSTLNCTTSLSAASTNVALIPNASVTFAGIAPNCTMTLTPETNAFGTSDITVTLADTGMPIEADFETFTFTVTAVNDAPILGAVGNQTVEENDFINVPVTVNDVDSVIMCSTISNFSVTSSNPALMPVANVVFSGTVPNCVATFTPTTNIFGTSNISITVNDNGTPNLQDVENFVLTVTEFNDPPVLAAVGNQTTNEDVAVVIPLNITDIDDVLNCNTSLSAGSSNLGLIPVANVVFGGTVPNCTATVTPIANASGLSNLTITVADTGVPVKTDFETFSFTVNAVNDAPVLAAIGAQSTNEDVALVIPLNITDVDSVLDCSTSLTAGSSNIGLVPVANVVFGGTIPNCTATVTPTANNSGLSSLTITVTDSGMPVLTDFETFNFTVNAVNDAPVLAAIGAQSTNEDIPLIIPLNITDVDSVLDCSTSLTAGSSNIGLVPVANVVFGGTVPNCTATVTPVANASGLSNLTITVADSGMPIQTDFETFSFTVNAVNDAPVLAAIGAQITNEDVALVIPLNITDMDSVLDCSTSLSAGSSNIGLVPVANVVFGGTVPNCTATVTPVANASGLSNLTITVADSGMPILTDFETFSFTVNAVNDAPVLAAIGARSTNEDVALIIPLNITDVDSVLDCSTSLTAGSSNVGLVPVANVVFGGTVPNCTATVTPVSNGSGLSNLTITVADSGMPVETDFETFTFTVNAVNDAPVLAAIGVQNTNEDVALVIPLNITDVDSVLDCSTSLTAGSSNVGLVPVANVVFGGTVPNCTATVTPLADANGATNLTITVADSGMPVETDFETFTFTVNAVNDAPVLAAIGAQNTNEDIALVIPLNITDVDSVLDCSTSLVAGSSNLGLVPVANVVFGGAVPNCTATVTPTAGNSGASIITITVADSGMPVETDFETFVFTVSPVNDAPVLAAIGAQNTNEDTPLIIPLNITDVDSVLDCSTSLTAGSSNIGLVPVANVVFGGTVPNCTATVTSVANANGNTNLTITVADSGMPVLTDFETFTFTVNAVNDAPVLAAIGAQSTNEDIALVIPINITDVDSVLDCSTSLTAGSSNIGLVPVANVVFGGTVPNCTATVTPLAEASGATNLTITVADSGMPVETDFETFVFTVNNTNDAPILAAIGNRTTNEDTPLIIPLNITDVDSVLDCSTSLTAGSSNIGLVPVANVVFGGTVPNCTATVTPVANANGTTNLTITAADSGMPVETDFETFLFTVNAINDPPVLGAIGVQSINEDNSLNINFTITDIDSGLDCTTSMSASSSNATLIDATDIVFSGTAPNCTATIPPELNQNGVVNLTIRVSDAEPLHDDETFAVTVNPINDAPTISNVADTSINEDTALGPIGFTVGDVDSVILCTSLNVTALSSNTALITNASLVIGGTYPNCTVSATPELNMSGSTTITLTVNDNEAPNLQATDTFVVTVNAINDAPTISNVPDQTIDEETTTGALAFTIDDVETGGTLNCNTSVAAVSSNTTIIPNGNIIIGGTAPNCTVTVTPPTDQYGGPVTITLTLTDSGTPLPVQQAIETFTVSVTNINDAPIISAFTDDDTDEDVPYVVNFTITDTDNVLSCMTSVSTTSSNATVVPVGNIVFSGVAPNCTATITPGSNQSGFSILNFTVTDGTLSDAEGFTLTVNDLDDTPIISAINDVTRPEDNTAGSSPVSSGYAINFTITDADSMLNCVTSMSAVSSNQALVPDGNIIFSGTAPNCTATITSVNNSNGFSDITFTVTDGVTSSNEMFRMTYTPVDDDPTISGIANRSTPEDTPVVINFTVNDVDSPLVCALGSAPSPFLARFSQNGGLVSNTDIVFGGTAPNCTATITPLPNISGNGIIFVRVNDGSGASISTSFTLTVTPVNDNPVISTIADTSFSAGVPTPINFTITDVDGPALNCVSSMSAVSSDQVVVPNGNIVFSGTAPNCTATVTAATTGVSNITYTVVDGAGGSAQTSNNVTGLTAGEEVISQSYSTATVTANSSVEDSEAHIINNEQVTVKVTVKDTNNNISGGGHWVVIQRGTGTSNGTLTAVTDHGDGTYTAKFTGQTVGTARTFNVFINGYAMTSVLPKVTVSTVAPNCLSYRNVGSSVSGVYNLDRDGDVGPASSYQAYCDMVTQGGGWTLAAVPRKGITPFAEATGLLSPNTFVNARNENVWSSTSQFKFSQLRVTDDAVVSNYSTARFNSTKTLAWLLANISTYTQSNLIAGSTVANADVSSSIGSTCFIFRGKSAAVAPWADQADYIFMGFHGGMSCSVPFNSDNNWDVENVAQQWLISGYDGQNSTQGPEETNNNVGQNFSGTDWINQDTPTLIWLK